MSTTTEKVCIEALSLPRQARMEVAHRLLVSLEDEDYSEEVEVSAPWRTEIEKRRQEFREGRANTVTAEEALRQAYAAIK